MSGVYLIEGAGLFKIGVAKDADERIFALQTGSPVELTLVKFFQCENAREAYNIEGWLHDKFKAQRIRREWFELSAMDVADFDALAMCARVMLAPISATESKERADKALAAVRAAGIRVRDSFLVQDATSVFVGVDDGKRYAETTLDPGDWLCIQIADFLDLQYRGESVTHGD